MGRLFTLSRKRQLELNEASERVADNSDAKIQLTEQQLCSAKLKIDQLNTRILPKKDQRALEVRKEQEPSALEVRHLQERLEQLKTHLPWMSEGIQTDKIILKHTINRYINYSLW